MVSSVSAIREKQEEAVFNPSPFLYWAAHGACRDHSEAAIAAAQHLPLGLAHSDVAAVIRLSSTEASRSEVQTIERAQVFLILACTDHVGRSDLIRTTRGDIQKGPSPARHFTETLDLAGLVFGSGTEQK